MVFGTFPHPALRQTLRSRPAVGYVSSQGWLLWIWLPLCASSFGRRATFGPESQDAAKRTTMHSRPFKHGETPCNCCGGVACPHS